MASQVQKTLEDQGWIDAITTFEKGINSNTSPLLLPNDQLSFAINTTVRNGYATHRPVLNKIAITFPDAATQTAIETGNFQGGNYYQPQTGLETLVSQIRGRLFQFTPAATGGTATVREVTIPGDPNPATAQQAWMWQSEQFLIINDGQSLPVFFDGNTSVRSLGSVQSTLGVLSAGYNSPAVGSEVAVTLTTPFTGTAGQTVFINGAQYRVVTPSTNQVTLVNGVDTVGKVYPIGTVIYSNPNVFGNISMNTILPSGVIPAGTAFVQAFVIPSLFPAIPVGTVISITDSTGHARRFNIVGHNPSTHPGYPGRAYGVTNVSSITGPITFQIGAQVTNATVHYPIAPVGVLSAPFTVPLQGSSTVAAIMNPYSGGANKPVVIGTFSYIIAAVPPSPPGTGINLQNINDTVGNTTTLALGADLLSIPQLPAGRMGAYILGRNWEALTDGRSFIASDIVNGSSGSAAYNYRDAVLNVTENTFLYEGGTFVVPGNVGNIRSITAAVTLDASLGQGPVMVGTPNVIFSCNAPVDRATWQSVTNPILTESLIGYGPQGQNNTINVNSDILFRSSTGICSLIQGKREFYSWGNTTVSNEVDRVLDLDSEDLLIFGSAVNFDNRLLEACGPTQVGAGFYFPGLVALDYSPISNMQEKLPAVYDGLWTGVNALQWIKGSFSGIERCFAFCFNKISSKIELYELLKTSDAGVADNAGFGPVPITWAFETCSLFKHIKTPAKGPMDLARLMDGEIYVDNVVGTVGFQAFYKPDQYPCWIPWHSWSICQNEATTTNPNSQPTYRTRMGLGSPSPVPCDMVNNRPLREGYTFQFKLVVTGHCAFLGAKFRAFPVPDTKFAKPICNPACVQPVTVCTPAP